MTKNDPYSATRNGGHGADYLPAAGLHVLLPVYDLLTRVLGSGRVHEALATCQEMTGACRILEIGCGTGNLALRVGEVQSAAQVTGIDPDPRALDIARRKARARTGLTFDQGYAQELPYPDGAFDRVLSSMMLHHLNDLTKAAALVEAFRVVEPGGMLLVADIHASDDTVPRLFEGAGFDHRAIGRTRLRVFGEVVTHCGTRPA